MVLVLILRSALTRVLELEKRQVYRAECLNAIAGHALVQVVNQDSDTSGEPVDALLSVALPVVLSRGCARANRTLPLERCSADVSLEIAGRCLD